MACSSYLAERSGPRRQRSRPDRRPAPGSGHLPFRCRPIEMRLCTYKTRLRGLGSGSGREGKPGLLARPLIELPVAIAVLTLLAAVLAPGTAAASPTAWTLILQLPAGRTLRVERGREALHGLAAPLLLRLRLRRGGVRAVRRVVAGTISIDSRRVENLQL